ncbi:diguanylate cyclase [Ideonella sp. 4Y16]|uniref:diguanylate cyclase domain-containing protein n=1 Tax=Ideonella alba TaxID=2824118 RepID=UPI001B394203|nr:diguanylate cyclase [Ideonella alba]MBQ0944811.1 diguanylate cyclase [Ideonella alba]
MRRWSGIGRLALRQTLLAALLGVLFGAGFSLLQVQHNYQVSVESERREMQQLLAAMREPAAQAGYHLNVQAAQVVVNGALSYVPVVEATLRSDFGEVLAQGRSQRPEAAPSQAWWTRFIAPTQAYSLPLDYGTARQRVGELHVVTAQAPRVQRFLDSAWRDLGLNVLRSLTVALALGALSFVTLTRPLTAIARRIGHGPRAGGPTPLAEAHRRDEIGQIATAFERFEREADERAASLEASARALAASEQRYRRIVETAGEGVWQLDEQGRTTLANEAMARMLGTRAALLTGRLLFDFVDDEDRPAAQALLRRRLDQDSERHEIRFRRADGRTLWAEVSTCSFAEADGQAAGTLAMVTDATDRRRRDEELRATNTRLIAMVSDLERHKADMALITELNELLQSARTEAEAYEVVGTAAAQLFPGCDGGFAVARGDEDLAVVGTWGATSCLPERYERSACWSIRRGGPHLLLGHQGIRCAHQPPGLQGVMLCTPLYVEGELLGVLHVHARETTEADAVRQRSELFGEVVKLGLSNLRLRESLREQALRDALTGLPNRRLFDETLPRELARCVRAGQPLTLAVVDVDHFKGINDSHGHEVGDRVLQAVAQALQQCIRTSDLASRYGGDEFMCLLPGMSAADARLRFERALERLSAEGAAGLPGVCVGFTVGLAAAPVNGGEPLALMRAADEALYAAKQAGRHRVEVAAAA